MSESDDLKTIATLLGNLIDRIEKVETQQADVVKHLVAVRKHTKELEEKEKTFRKATLLMLKNLMDRPA